MIFIANFIRFPAVQTIWKSVEIWQSYGEFNGGNFFDTQWYIGQLQYETLYSLYC